MSNNIRKMMNLVIEGNLNEGPSSKVKKVLNNPGEFLPQDGDDDFNPQDWEELAGYMSDAMDPEDGDTSWEEVAKKQLKILSKDRTKKFKSFVGGNKGVIEYVKAYAEENL